MYIRLIFTFTILFQIHQTDSFGLQQCVLFEDSECICDCKSSDYMHFAYNQDKGSMISCLFSIYLPILNTHYWSLLCFILILPKFNIHKMTVRILSLLTTRKCCLFQNILYWFLNSICYGMLQLTSRLGKYWLNSKWKWNMNTSNLDVFLALNK